MTPDETRDDLADWLADTDGAAPDLDRDPDPPHDATEAERYLRKLAHLAAEAREVEEVVKAERQRLDEWRSDRMTAMERADTWLRTALEGWFRDRQRAGGTKSLSLPSGTLRLRKASKRPVDFDPGDEDGQTVLASIYRQNPDLVRVSLSLNKQEVAKRCKPGPDGQAIIPETGETLPGVRFLPAPGDRFYVEVDR